MEGNVLAAAAAAAASHQHSQGVLGSILSGSGGANQGPPGGVGGPSSGGGEQPGPIRIRNLEDLIRQLEHSSRHLSSSPGSDEMGGGDHDRHFRYQLLHASFDFIDSFFQPGIYRLNSFDSVSIEVLEFCEIPQFYISHKN